MLSFGVTVLPDPPYHRLLELTKLAEAQGFEYGWTYDSHVLWQESMPVMALLADKTSKIKLGHMVTNPATRDPTVLASAYATLQDISNGRMIMGIGRGDSARALHRPQADEGGRVRGSAADDQAVHERQGGALERQGPPAQVGAAGAAGDRDARRGLRPEGARRRGPRRATASSSSSPTPTSSSGSWRRRGRRPRRPGATRPRSSASSARRATSPTTSPTRATRCAGSRRWSRTTSRT